MGGWVDGWMDGMAMRAQRTEQAEQSEHEDTRTRGAGHSRSRGGHSVAAALFHPRLPSTVPTNGSLLVNVVVDDVRVSECVSE